ncbi:ubiquitin-protein ligase E3B-like [Dendronephthya gigantea]|uniref:ubiquitin-protein ligase E3B-like n=1 Tax=Dendronephthya gigantea TaxID=151771 RepID=UPI001069804E|nr:ubiquitin-protein ligase E3B-like [Dendronephthya gigantea]
MWYIYPALTKDWALLWITQLKKVLVICSRYIKKLKSRNVYGLNEFIYGDISVRTDELCPNFWKRHKTYQYLLRHGEKWKPGLSLLCKNVLLHLEMNEFYSSLRELAMSGLCRNDPALRSTQLAAILTLSLRVSEGSGFNEKSMKLFQVNIMSIPGQFLHFTNISPQRQQLEHTGVTGLRKDHGENLHTSHHDHQSLIIFIPSYFCFLLLIGLSFNEEFLLRLLKFLQELGRDGGLSLILSFVSSESSQMLTSIQSLLILFCDCCGHLIPIVDDYEMYEKQKPFSLEDLTALSGFLNTLTYKLLWNRPRGKKNSDVVNQLDNTDRLLSLVYSLLMLIYDRDSRRRFTPKNHWLIKELKIGSFKSELTAGKPRASEVLQMIPHVVPHRDGLDEAGIDQDGVFKEFLEEAIKQAFNPQLNLFKLTQDQRLYPSPTSCIHDNHLALFEFVGKMLGKAVYEVGIVVDVPFAPFFLSLLLSRQHGALYSSIDELPSLDPNLYKNLNYVKNYDGDLTDLGLTFSFDEEFLGKIITHDLKPGGRTMDVTDKNKISYILMAHYKMCVQLRDQSRAFFHGFREFIQHNWLGMFSGPELQKLISGDSTTLDVSDLRANTTYYGGYHNKHRVINWLWEIVEKDFNDSEKSAFLKYLLISASKDTQFY